MNAFMALLGPVIGPIGCRDPAYTGIIGVISSFVYIAAQCRYLSLRVVRSRTQTSVIFCRIVVESSKSDKEWVHLPVGWSQPAVAL